MTIEQTLLTVLTVAVVILIVLIVTVLVVAWQALKRVKKASAEIQRLTEKSTLAAGKVAPWGAAAISAAQVNRIISKLRR